MLITGSFIGEGSFGSVYLVRRISDSQLYALKKVSDSGNETETNRKLELRNDQRSEKPGLMKFHSRR